MVLLHVKKGDRDLFLYETNLKCLISEIVKDLVFIYNGQLRIERLCYGKVLLRGTFHTKIIIYFIYIENISLYYVIFIPLLLIFNSEFSHSTFLQLTFENTPFCK